MYCKHTPCTTVMVPHHAPWLPNISCLVVYIHYHSVYRIPHSQPNTHRPSRFTSICYFYGSNRSNLIFRWSNRQTSIFRTSLTHLTHPQSSVQTFSLGARCPAPRTEARTASLESFGKVDFAKTDAKKWEVSPQSPQIKGIQTNIGRDCTNFPTA